MKMRVLLFLLVAAMAFLQTGCKSMSAKGRNNVVSKWKTFADMKSTFDLIEPGVTTEAELIDLGFGPSTNSNVRVLTYLDMMNRFLPNNSVKVEDLPVAVREALAQQEKSHAYELEVIDERNKRYGNLLLDVLSFDRKTCYYGWNFKALILVNDDRVVYKLWSGQPNTERHERKTRPLGPIQELEGLLGRFVR
ncbi:MAG: hypothetical protein K0Q55_1802 [Verrucomicrobia bacterium]|nr:hypothetical protein [Verrucomicrobiota bacterium]